MMLRLFIFLIILIAPFSVAAQEEIDAPFDRLQGNAWALVLTGPDIDPMYVTQLASLTAAAPDLIKREIVVIRFHGRTLVTYPELSVADYQLPSLNGSKKGRSSHQKIKALEEQLQTNDDVFSVVLVGKEGLTRYVWTAPVRPEAVFHMMDNPLPGQPGAKPAPTKP